MELGGSIELKGFPEEDSGSLVIIKKIVGNFIRELSERQEDFESLTLVLSQKDPFLVEGVLKLGKKQLKATGADTNVFFALDRTLKELDGKA
jgi:hypothetical protein